MYKGEKNNSPFPTMLAYTFQGIFSKVPIRKAVTKCVFPPFERRTFMGLVILHFHLIGPPVFAQVLPITIKNQCF